MGLQLPGREHQEINRRKIEEQAKNDPYLAGRELPLASRRWTTPQWDPSSRNLEIETQVNKMSG